MPLNHRFHLVILFLSSKRHFGAVNVKFSLNCISSQKMTKLQNTVRRLIIIVFSLSYDAYNQSVTFKILRNSRLTLLLPNRWPVCKTLSRASYSSFSARLLVRKQYFGVLTVNFLLNKIMTHKMASLENTVTRLRIIVLS